MNINGIPGPLSTIRGPQEVVAPRVERELAPGGQPAPATSVKAAHAHDVLGAERSPASLPTEPPPGTDPELWSILSAEERVYFAKLGAMGPLTYGRISTQMQSQPAVARGGRLDVRA